MSCCVACSEIGALNISDTVTVHYEGNEMVVMESVEGQTMSWENEVVRIPVNYCTECGRMMADANL